MFSLDYVSNKVSQKTFWYLYTNAQVQVSEQDFIASSLCGLQFLLEVALTSQQY